MIRTSALIIGLLVLGGCCHRQNFQVVVTLSRPLPCPDKVACNFTETYDEWMPEEEFKFKYDHDKAFRDSISSYSFQ